VDEMHDMNEAMSIITRKLLETNALHFCGVGDSDQVIHSASGAEQRFMSADIDFGNGSIKRYPLTATHRFSQSLGKIAGALADKPYASKAGHDTRVQRLTYTESEGALCADAVIKVAKAWHVQESGKMSGFSILLRHAWQSIPIENALLRHELQYDIKGFTSYALQPEVLFIRFILAMVEKNYDQFKSPKTMDEAIRALVFFFQVELGFEIDKNDSKDARMQYAIAELTLNPSLFEAFFKTQIYENASPVMKRRVDAAIKVFDNESDSDGWFSRFLNALEIESWVKDIFYRTATSI
jgi:DNA helicase II / ATP-dependent DNA helicase PcrA